MKRWVVIYIFSACFSHVLVLFPISFCPFIILKIKSPKITDASWVNVLVRMCKHTSTRQIKHTTCLSLDRSVVLSQTGPFPVIFNIWDKLMFEPLINLIWERLTSNRIKKRSDLITVWLLLWAGCVSLWMYLRLVITHSWWFRKGGTDRDLIVVFTVRLWSNPTVPTHSEDIRKRPVPQTCDTPISHAE